jgi:hypothetical protein
MSTGAYFTMLARNFSGRTEEEKKPFQNSNQRTYTLNMKSEMLCNIWLHAKVSTTSTYVILTSPFFLRTLINFVYKSES